MRLSRVETAMWALVAAVVAGVAFLALSRNGSIPVRVDDGVYSDVPSFEERRAAERSRYAREQREQLRANQVVISPREITKVLFLGDSMTGGYGSTSPDLAYVPRVKAWLGIQGVEGDYVGINEAMEEISRGVEIADITPQVPRQQFDLIFIELGSNNGTNDGYRAKRTEKDYASLMDRVRTSSPDARVVCLGPWGSEPDASRVNEAIKSACVAGGGKYHPLEQLFSVPGNRYESQLMPDGTPIDNFHPTDQGYAQFAQVAIDAVRVEP